MFFLYQLLPETLINCYLINREPFMDVMYNSLLAHNFSGFAVNSFSYVHACFNFLFILFNFLVNKTTNHRPYPKKSQIRNRLQFFNASWCKPWSCGEKKKRKVDVGSSSTDLAAGIFCREFAAFSLLLPQPPSSIVWIFLAAYQRHNNGQKD